LRWEGTAVSKTDAPEGEEGKAGAMGLPDDLLRCLVPGEPFVEYGIVEHRYSRRRPKEFEQLVKDYSHTRIQRNKPYTASSFIAGTLERMAARGEVLLSWGPASGHWSYNETISYWALPPGPVDLAAKLTYAEFARAEGFDAASTSNATALDPELVVHFRRAVEKLEARFSGARLTDENVEAELRSWLDGREESLPWAYPERVTEDEWFFITTLYGEMTLAGQRAHIRRFFPVLFVQAAGRDVSKFVPGMKEFQGLRSGWMAARLCRMGEVLRDQGISMADYTEGLRRLESAATPEDPMPALDAIVRDHRATGWKTLSVFVRDCVGGNCFPIDTRVEKELHGHGLPVNERDLVRLALHVARNPREVARMFYEAGGTL
jgi:hypothetical protein